MIYSSTKLFCSVSACWWDVWALSVALNDIFELFVNWSFSWGLLHQHDSISNLHLSVNTTSHIVVSCLNVPIVVMHVKLSCILCAGHDILHFTSFATQVTYLQWTFYFVNLNTIINNEHSTVQALYLLIIQWNIIVINLAPKVMVMCFRLWMYCSPVFTALQTFPLYYGIIYYCC